MRGKRPDADGGFVRAMKASQFFVSTLKEAPADAEVVSHKLMTRAGLIKKLGAGIYNYMPMGLRVIRKVEAIVREEMNRAGAVAPQQIMGHTRVKTHGHNMYDQAWVKIKASQGRIIAQRVLPKGPSDHRGFRVTLQLHPVPTRARQ